jgi:hypothetical protein
MNNDNINESNTMKTKARLFGAGVLLTIAVLPQLMTTDGYGYNCEYCFGISYYTCETPYGPYRAQCSDGTWVNATCTPLGAFAQAGPTQGIGLECTDIQQVSCGYRLNFTCGLLNLHEDYFHNWPSDFLFGQQCGYS